VLRSARFEHAELVSLGVGEHNPRLLALPDVHSGGTQPTESLYFGVSVVWPEVEVQPILDRLLRGDTHEQEPRKTISSWSDLELLGVVVDDNPAERLSPPVAERAWVSCVNDHLLPLEAHDSIVETARSGGTGGRVTISGRIQMATTRQILMVFDTRPSHENLVRRVRRSVRRPGPERVGAARWSARVAPFDHPSD
jgi:hypothetical protein